MAKPGWLSRKTLFGASVAGAIFFMVVGVILWGGFNTAMEVTNTMDFCISCHEMEDTVYQEYKGSVHYNNGAGVQATCPDCHVPRPWVHKVVRKIKASRELYHKMMGTVSTPEKFDKHRPTMAKRVWETMKATDSRECRNCHDFDTMDAATQRKRARKQHLFAMKEGHTCIDCHKGIAHKDVTDRVDPEYLAKLEAPKPEYQQEVPEHFQAGMKVAAARAEEAKEKERQERRQRRKSQQAQIEAAVEDAIAQYKAGQSGGGAAATPAAGFGMDWGDVPVREVTLFYPGQTSMEWALEGSDHGGARVYRKAGDRCFDCHEGEEAKMGEKMVTGEKAETTPIPGKRPGIPVQVQAAHDGEYLYMHFTWPDTEHVPVPFVDGGKMDPKNPVKLALMLATDAVEQADQAGCWGTCHHDARTMPHAPEDPSSDRLDLSGGVTKYIAESRTEIEVEDEPRGGWDKLKDADAIQKELEAGHFMDLLRHKAGTGESEDGYILAERHMEDGGDGVSFTSEKQGGNWVVTMQRKLDTGGKGDLALATDQVYNIGFAIHDDFSDARYHHVSLGFKLGFDNEDAEINAVQREASAPAASAGGGAPAAGGGGAVAADVDWGKAGLREVTLFYPGQTSMEWALEGSDHGGARVYRKAGDRCFDCHEGEEAKMGEKMVTGEKAETTPIPGKRPGIPVQVQAAHDGEYLYMHFTWPDTEHVPVPFVDGGKMDPKNPVKLALMLATDAVEQADQAGCWGTCHHDARTMPHAPEDPSSDRLDLSGGVTKYIAESRTEIEVEDEPRGGWDKLKDADAIQKELEAGHFMDLLRHKAGTGESEDGYILAERHMEDGGDGVSFTSEKQGGNWVVTMQRKLDTGGKGDLALATDQVYNIGFAIHDDFSDARYHHVSLGFKLGFDNEDAEINARKQ